MSFTNRHKVFISFQHGCEDTVRACGKKYFNPWGGYHPNFAACSGNCGRNGLGPFPAYSKCQFYNNCGHYWKERFEFMMSESTDKMISKAVGDGDIQTNITIETIRQKIRDEFIADASITVVLIGPETWKRKHVDWEISSSIKNTINNPRCGLFGIILPTHPSFSKGSYNPFIIPPRLYYNCVTGFAHIYDWTENIVSIENMIHAAFERRDKFDIDNTYPMFVNNRPTNQTQWQT